MTNEQRHELELRLTVKFNNLAKTEREFGSATYEVRKRMAKFQAIVYRCNGHIYRHGSMYEVKFERQI